MKFKTTLGSLTFACLLGPLSIVPATLLGLMAMRVYFNDETMINMDGMGFILGMSLIGLIYAYPLTMLVGLPLLLLLEKLHLDNVLTILLASQIPVVLMLFFTKGDYSSPAAISYFSACVAMCCWYIYQFTKPAV